MSYQIPSIEATALKYCERCQMDHQVIIKLRKYTSDDLARYIDIEIDDQATKDGWKGGYCPFCAEEHKAELLADSKADDEIEL